MIHAVIFENKREECTGFQVEGHAGYSEEGQDIVCAAASMLVMNTVNAIDMFTEDTFSFISDEDEGIISCHFTETPSHDAGLLLNTMIMGLSDMANDENYKEYIDLTFEEV